MISVPPGGICSERNDDVCCKLLVSLLFTFSYHIGCKTKMEAVSTYEGTDTFSKKK